MLALKNTENLTGASISGDYWDLDELCTALYHITGDENRYFNLQGSRMRLLGITYDLRHAYQGDRNIEFVFNGLHKEWMKQHDFIAPDKNAYYSVEILWPELIYALFAINDFIKLYKKDKHATDFDIHIVTIRKFQGIIAEGLKENMSGEEHKALLATIFEPTATVDEYAIQYIDMLNLSYIGMMKEQRTKAFSTVAKNIVEENQEYQSIKQQVIAEANKTKSSIHDLRLNVEYPEDIEW
ncbi:DUF6904 family protein [Psychrobacillus sp.]|uniref:DUF6904 family protein n=1 Tax=Psychrobacillus sp. TaxID=1871623 RepID=UPI0028BEA17D|nr:hypothetical protein [Psychrobacillus sp.]